MERSPDTDMNSLILSALGQTGEGVAIVDLSGNIIYVNKAFALAHGYTVEELSGMNLSVFHREEDMPLVNHANSQVMETGSFSGEVPHLHRNGTVFPALMQSSLVRDNSGRAIGIVGTLRDITDIRKGISDLQEARHLLKSVLDAIPDIIGIQDDSHGMISYNAAGYSALKQTPEAIRGKKCYQLIGRSEPCEVCATSISYGTKETARVEKFVPELGKWLDVRSYPILDESGKIIKVIEHLRDITDKREAEARSRRLEEQIMVTQKLESLGVMAGGIAHDFNNILLSIMGNADLARRESNSREITGYLEEIITSAKGAADLAARMLDYSGKSEPRKTCLDVNELIRDTAQMLHVSISRKTTLEYSLADGLSPVLADLAQLRQVIMNLIMNASEALEDHPGTVFLSTAMGRISREELAECYVNDDLPGGEYVILSVRDTGSGMNPGTLSRVFDPFFTTKFAGRGLGLASVLGIVRNHQGGIRVKTEPGRGTEFTVYLPVCPTAEPVSPGETDEEITGLGNVLLVDDEEFVRAVAGKMLTRAGYRVEYASNGMEAVRKMRANPGEIDCVILDLTMPVMDGLEAFERLISLKPDARIIISSGFTQGSIIEKFKGKPLAGILHKPYSLHEITLAVSQAVKRPPGMPDGQDDTGGG